MHKWFDHRRNTAYAHTDEEASGRKAAVTPLRGEPGVAAWGLEWVPFPREWISPAIELFMQQRQRFRDKTLELEKQIEAFGRRGSGAPD